MSVQTVVAIGKSQLRKTTNNIDIDMLFGNKIKEDITMKLINILTTAIIALGPVAAVAQEQNMAEQRQVERRLSR